MAAIFFHYLTISVRYRDDEVNLRPGDRVMLVHTKQGTVLRQGIYHKIVTPECALRIVNRGKPVEGDWYDKAMAWLEKRNYQPRIMAKKAKYISGNAHAQGIVEDRNGNQYSAYITALPGRQKVGMLHRTILGINYYVPNHSTT